MRIKRNSNEFKGFHRCTVLREHKDLNLTRDRNFWYDSAVVVKEIMKGYLKRPRPVMKNLWSAALWRIRL